MIGIDEAGRGPVLGPLVVAALQVKSEQCLEELGVRDSKKLKPKRREKLYQELKACSEFSIESVSAKEIDDMRSEHNLNEIERILFSRAAMGLDFKGDVIYVDCCDTDEVRFGMDLESRIDGACVRSRHKADEIYPCVSAASIVAKVHRDRYVYHLNEMAKEKWGLEIGSGYPSDPLTTRFLEEITGIEGTMPFFVRRSWKTAKRFNQSTLDAYNE